MYRVYLIKVGSMNYGICASDSVDKVHNYYNEHLRSNYDLEDITDKEDLPVLEVKVTNEIKGILK